jgi:myxalamid-type polyketide synthase MxaE and MxaD
VHLAVRSLRSGESTLALAGGVNTILQPHISVAYSQSRMMAPDGRCKFGDAAGDGYVRSEGAGLIV